ncbi:MAG: bacteriohemerythrin [Treponema sp.]|nr:bacteriohemerythrin [Treponema sp.]
MKNSKELIVWDKKFQCGIKVIDEQHKQLVELINEMFNHATGNHIQENDYFNRAIREMVKYVKIHFAAEEKILLATKFPGYNEHKKEHESFILAILNIVNEHKAGKRIVFSNYCRFLKDWVLSHIAMIDKQYFEYLKSIAARKEDGTLSINLEDVENR